MATLRSLAISLLRLDGHTNIAAANRHHARDPQRMLRLLQTAQTTLPGPCHARRVAEAVTTDGPSRSFLSLARLRVR